MLKNPYFLGLLYILATTQPANTGPELFSNVSEIDLLSSFECISSGQSQLSGVFFESLENREQRVLRVQELGKSERVHNATCDFSASGYYCTWGIGNQIQLSLDKPVIKRSGKNKVQYFINAQYVETGKKNNSALSCRMPNTKFIALTSHRLK